MRVRVRLGGRERGASGVELAIIAPALLVLIFFCVQGALWLYGRQVALQAAREGVSQLRVLQQDPTAEQIASMKTSVQNYAKSVGSGALVDPQAGDPTIDVDPATSLQTVSVTVSGHSISLIPFASFGVTEKASGAVEQFQVDG